VKDTENMEEQRIADVRTVGWSLRQKELLKIVLDAIQSLRSSARVSAFCRFVWNGRVSRTAHGRLYSKSALACP
jgi:hypothetical protein